MPHVLLQAFCIAAAVCATTSANLFGFAVGGQEALLTWMLHLCAREARTLQGLCERNII